MVNVSKRAPQKTTQEKKRIMFPHVIKQLTKKYQIRQSVIETIYLSLFPARTASKLTVTIG